MRPGPWPGDVEEELIDLPICDRKTRVGRSNLERVLIFDSGEKPDG
jgi:hypothetical protein